MEITAGPPRWRPEGIASADLVRGYRAARELQLLPVPPHLGKELAGYIMRAGTELIARDIDPLKFTADGYVPVATGSVPGPTGSRLPGDSRPEPGSR
ncbi:MAG: hypothetical protein QOG28_6185 [Trebonia sp.]|nr:hypothetical protein [Trebonia sp.]